MDRARRGRRGAERQVTLVQEIDADKQARFLLYSPVYSESGVPGSLAERREKLKGGVYAALLRGRPDRGHLRRRAAAGGVRPVTTATRSTRSTCSTRSAGISRLDDEVMVERAGHRRPLRWTASLARATAKPSGLPLTLLVIGPRRVAQHRGVRGDARARAGPRPRAHPGHRGGAGQLEMLASPTCSSAFSATTCGRR